jgi:hypothetical protein
MRVVKFDLYPWELKLSPLECEGEVDSELEIDGEICQIRHIRSHSSSWPYFRFLNAPEEHFMLANFIVSDTCLRWEPLGYNNDRFPQVMEHSFKSAFEVHTWGRYFWLRPDLSCVQNISEYFESVWNIFLLANGQGTFVGFRNASSNGSKSMSWNSVIPFQWSQGPSPEILRARTNSQWIEWLQGEIGKPESSIRFAHDFAGLSSDEARLRFTVWRHGNLQEWEEVIRWVLQSESPLQKDVPISRKTHWAWPLVAKEGVEQGKHGTLNRFGEDGHRFSSDRRDILTSQRLQIVSCYFAPALDLELLERRLAIEYHPRPLYLGVSTLAPSAHERLEAALNLKAWARGKFPPSEIEVLCEL